MRHNHQVWTHPAEKMTPPSVTRRGTPTQKRTAKRQHNRKARYYFRRELRDAR